MPEKFTLYWLDGKKEVVTGPSVAEAMTLAGYSGGAVPALDFWAEGEDDTYSWLRGRWVHCGIEDDELCVAGGAHPTQDELEREYKSIEQRADASRTESLEDKKTEALK